MTNDSTPLWLLAVAAAIYFVYTNQPAAQAQKDLINCQSEFKAFKDGLTYGR